MDKKEFVESLRKELRRGGITRAITAQLKEEICSSYFRTSCSHNSLTNVKYKNKIRSLEHRALRSLIFDFLICDDLHLTLSVYSTESGLDDNHHYDSSFVMSPTDICKAFEIKTETKLFKMITKTQLKDKSQGAEHSMIGKILSCIPSLINDASPPPRRAVLCASTQTHFDDENSSVLLARRDLEDQLRQIKDKYAQQCDLVSQSYRSSSDIFESQMFAFQKECEERERARMERELEVYKRTAVEAIKRELSEKYSFNIEESKRTLNDEYDRNLKQLKNKEEKLREEFLAREKEREKEHLVDLHKLMREIEQFKKRENDNKSLLDVERRKLELEEQRVKNILLTAEMKLNFAETKEKEIRESITNEFNRVRLTAKQTYDDASDSVKKQMEFYAIEFDRLNALRRENENRLIAHEALEIESSRLRVENVELKTNLDAALAQLETLKISKEDAENKGSYEINLLQNEIRNLRDDLSKALEFSTRSKNEVARVSERYESTIENLEQKNKSLTVDLLNSKQEQQVLHEQVHELQKLLRHSEGALSNVHMHHHEDERNSKDPRRFTKEYHFQPPRGGRGGVIQKSCSSSNFVVDTSKTKQCTTAGASTKKHFLYSTDVMNDVVWTEMASSILDIDPKEHIGSQVVNDDLIQETFSDTSMHGDGVKQTNNMKSLHLAGKKSHCKCNSSLTSSPYQRKDSSTTREIINKDHATLESTPIGMIIKPSCEIPHSAKGKINVNVIRSQNRSKSLSNPSSTTNGTNGSTSICLLKREGDENGQNIQTNPTSLNSMTSRTKIRGTNTDDESTKYDINNHNILVDRCGNVVQKQGSQDGSDRGDISISYAEETRQGPSVITNGVEKYTILEGGEKDDDHYVSDFEIESMTTI